MADDDERRKKFKEWLKEYHRLVRWLLMRWLGYLSEADMEDLVTEVFTRVWQALGQGNEIDNPKGFILGVARNVAREARRKRRRDPSGPTLGEDAEDFDPPDDDRLSSDERDKVAEIYRALRDFPDPDKVKVFWDRVVRKHAHKQIADDHDVSESTVKRWVEEVLEWIRKRLGGK